MSSLNTFGAILTYAIELEGNLHEFYKAMGGQERASEADKRREKLERTRRENVVEITLEPIEGLDENDYVFDFEDTSANNLAKIEREAAKFYEDVTPKINVRQAQRVLERCGKAHQALV